MELRNKNGAETQDALRNLTTAQHVFSRFMRRSCSSTRSNSAADDAAGYSVSAKLKALQPRAGT